MSDSNRSVHLSLGAAILEKIGHYLGAVLKDNNTPGDEAVEQFLAPILVVDDGDRLWFLA